MRALRSMGLATTAALLLATGASAQTSTFEPEEAIYCVTVMQDAYDYTGDPEAFIEALAAGDVTITLVSQPGYCVTAYAPEDGTLSYDEWNDHVIASLDERSTLADGVGENSSLSRMRGVIVDLRDWARAEQAWLKDIEPDPCYQSEYDDWNEGTRIVAKQSQAILNALDNLNSRAMKRAFAATTKGLDIISEVGDAYSDSCDEAVL